MWPGPDIEVQCRAAGRCEEEEEEEEAGEEPIQTVAVAEQIQMAVAEAE